MFEPTRVDLTALLREVCGLHRDLVPTAQIAEDFGPAPLTLIGDHKLLTHLFSNLVSNGIKYSGTKARLKVSAAALGRDIVVVVEDHGIGIAESERELVFERYFRGRNTAGTIGTGVGLYLVKAVVELHHGQVALDSKLHEGSRFTIRLPRAIDCLRWQLRPSRTRNLYTRFMQTADNPPGYFMPSSPKARFSVFPQA